MPDLTPPAAVEWPVTLREMGMDDIEPVLVIERDTFAIPWPANAFRYDLTQNPYAHYYVITPLDEPTQILAYAGLWCVVDEAHICNIAVARAWRGRGLGELLLLHLLEQAAALGMYVATLEVRRSNLSAQALYRKYGFEIVGDRRHYYSDNDEDALIMTTGMIGHEPYWGRLQALKLALFTRMQREAGAQSCADVS